MSSLHIANRKMRRAVQRPFPRLEKWLSQQWRARRRQKRRRA